MLRRGQSRGARRASGQLSRTRALVIALGESLIVGQASNSTGFPATYPPNDGTLWKYNDSGQWLEMVEPNDDPGPSPIYVNAQDVPGSYGHGYPGLFSWRLRKLLGPGQQVGLVPCGKSGTRSWDWATNGGLVSDAVAKIRAAMASGSPAVVLVDQGVNDCAPTTDPDGLTWTQRWSAVVAHVRAQCGISTAVPWIFKQLPISVPTGYDTTEWNNLRAEQAAFNNPSNGIYVIAGSDGPYIGAGNSHYNAVGNKDQSRRAYEAYKASPGPLGTGPSLAGRRGFSAFPTGTTVFGSRTSQGVKGSATTGLGVVVMGVHLSTLSGTQKIAECTLNASNLGWLIRAVSGNIRFQAANGSAFSTAINFAPTNYVGKIFIAALSHDLSNVVAYMDRAQVGTTAFAGFAPASSRSMVFGADDGGGSPCTTMGILGACGRDSPLSLPEIQAICDASKAAGQLALGGVTMEHGWSCPVESYTPDYWKDTIGLHDLEFVQGDERNLTYYTYDPATIGWMW